MNVLMIVSWYTKKNREISAGIFHYEQAMALKKECNIALYWPFDSEIGRVEKCEENGLLVYRSGNKNKQGLNCLDILKNFRAVIEDYKPDIIHAHVASSAGKYSVIMAKIYNIPIVVTEHVPLELMDLRSLKNKMMMSFVYRCSNANVCVSDYLNKGLSKEFPLSRFFTIYNPVSDLFVNRRLKNATLNEKVNCGIVANFYDKNIKGFQYLLPAIRKLVDEGVDIELGVIGGGDYLDYYKKMCNELSINDHVMFYGYRSREELIEIVEKMNFMVSASLFESAGVNIEEALTLGKPVVVTNSGGGNSLVDYSNAIVVEKESIDALADGIKRMIQNYRKYNFVDIAKCAREMFSIKKSIKKYLDIYEKLLAMK